ncbi:unnamed protein product [Ambrosiozyma monospora]|uniref:Unnamed protein product n=1 Tax=Ambrosiozyma monospora TaxID=43982 RepID=A0A9W6SZY8_AMBMO|nr:unnamed protein product [Ambrosiozyma monospora]
MVSTMTTSKWFSVFTSILSFVGATQAATTTNKGTGCNFKTGSNDLTPGFNAKFFSYEYNDSSDFSDADFYATRYSESGSMITSLSGITDPNFSTSYKPYNVKTGAIYGADVTFTNIVLELSGYFVPTSSGIHTFTLNKIDDAAMVWFGNEGHDCCTANDEQTSDKLDSLLWTYKPLNKGTTSKTTSIYLEMGVYYPIKIVFVNIRQTAALEFTVEDSNGKVADFADQVWQISDAAADCEKPSSSALKSSSRPVTSSSIESSSSVLASSSKSSSSVKVSSSSVTLSSSSSPSSSSSSLKLSSSSTSKTSTPVSLSSAQVSSSVANSSSAPTSTVKSSSSVPSSSSTIKSSTPVSLSSAHVSSSVANSSSAPTSTVKSSSSVPSSAPVSSSVVSSSVKSSPVIPSSVKSSSSVPSSVVSSVEPSSSSVTGPSSCPFDSSSVPFISGLSATLYSYPINLKAPSTQPAFYAGGYKSNEIIGSASGITDPTINFYFAAKTEKSGEIYGKTITATNFVAELTGYFVPTSSGEYTFSFNGVDDESCNV